VIASVRSRRAGFFAAKTAASSSAKRAKEFTKIEAFDQALREIVAIPKADVKEPKAKRRGKNDAPP